MWECDCGALPVIDEAHEVRGMITDRDVCMATWLQHRAPQDLAVAGAMSERLYYCSPTDSLSAAEELMRTRQVRRIPVLSPDRRLLGILSLADIAKATGFASDMGLLASDVSLTLADIVRHRCRHFQGSRATIRISRERSRLGDRSCPRACSSGPRSLRRCCARLRSG